ncbi:TetR/AcrR family transcriptional regulator [Nocardia jiangxiensis]|uniref:TetR/AcrR family transcriptional regulator n=1 Tax=Nocardia jiangxiensis TaxID=282685 RepID=A0ABW6RYN4_9NOCA
MIVSFRITTNDATNNTPTTTAVCRDIVCPTSDSDSMAASDSTASDRACWSKDTEHLPDRNQISSIRQTGGAPRRPTCHSLLKLSVAVNICSCYPDCMARSELRQVTRDAIRTRITEEAERLFVEQGFETTTVDVIASRVGMSQRSFFRYFGSKEDVVLDNYDRLGQDLLDRFSACPSSEPDWVALRRAFDVVAEQYADSDRRQRGAAIQQIVELSPALLSGYLERLDRMQRQLAIALRGRIVARNPHATVDDVALRAVVGAAFACLQAVVSEASQAGSGADLGERLDAVMTIIKPCGLE